MAAALPTTVDPNKNIFASMFPNSGVATNANGASSGQQGNSNFLTGLSTDNSLYNQATNQIGDMMSGKAYNPFSSAMEESLARAAQQMRAQTAATNAPNVGQGSAVRAQQGTENNIFQNIASTKLQEAQGTQQMQQAGLSAFSGLVGLGQQQQQINLQAQNQQNTQQWTAFNSAISAGDFNTAKNSYKALTGLDLNTDQLKNTQDLQNTTQKYSAIQSMVATGATMDQINAKFGDGAITADQYKSMFDNSQAGQFTAGLASSKDIASLQTSTSKEIAGLQVSSNQTIAQMQIQSSQKLAADSNYLTQQGIDVDKASKYGYNDANGNHVPGSMEIAASTLGVQKWQAEQTVDLAKQQLGLDFDKFSEAKAEFDKTSTLEGAKLDEAKAEFKANYGLSYDQFKASTDQWQQTFNESKAQFAATNSLQAKQLGLNEKQINAAIDYQNTMAGLEGEKLHDAEDQFDKQFGLTVDQFNTAKDQWDKQFTESHNQWQQNMDQTTKYQNGQLDLQQQELQYQRWYSGQQIGIQQGQLDIQKATAQSQQYWDTADKFSSYAQTHLDTDPNNLSTTDLQQAAGWYKAQTGKEADINDSAFKQWAGQEFKAATDKRLTNPFDATAYAINSSTSLSDNDKSVFLAAVKDPSTYGLTVTKDANGNSVFQSTADKNAADKAAADKAAADKAAKDKAAAHTVTSVLFPGTL